ncbi:MAG: dltS [Oscillospiraceae bacterium]|nr:dltS [Oscillospiraceae bacterium]
MIRKLRRKFVLVNMLLISLVLIMVFAILLITSYQSNVRKSTEALHQAASSPGLMQLPILDRQPSGAMGNTPSGNDIETGSSEDSNGKSDSSGSSSASDAGDASKNGTGADNKPSGDSGKSDTFQNDDADGQFTTIIPVFSVILDSSNQVTQETGGNVDMSDEMVSSAVSEALATGKKDGLLSDLNLRFTISNGPTQTVIAFADQTWELDAMRDLILSSLLVGGIALFCFFCISVFLSGISVHPVDEAWRRQQQFLADASHELKTPLTVILADTNILLTHQEDTIARQVKWVEYIQNEAERMKQLVQDMLFLAKGDAAKLDNHLTHTTLCLTDLMWSSLLPFESVAFEQGVSLDADISPGLHICGNENQLQRLVIILVDNACKYAGKPGAVKVSLKRAQDKISLSVHNTGEPIPPERLPHVFERFFRADTARTRETGGYGLGLAIAQSIVDTHRGKIFVESTQESGTTFTVLFPESKEIKKMEPPAS